MVTFFGVFDPGHWTRQPSDEAPAKANFFGGAEPRLPEPPLSRLETDLLFLKEQAPEPRELADEISGDQEK